LACLVALGKDGSGDEKDRERAGQRYRAAVAWEGNSDVGTGRMEITDSTPSSKVIIKLDFLKPFEGHNIAEFTLERTGDATHVTWAMFGPQAYLMKLMSVFVDCDNMIGKDFQTGLANLKALAEK
jgi:hypothetical protein